MRDARLSAQVDVAGIFVERKVRAHTIVAAGRSTRRLDCCHIGPDEPSPLQTQDDQPVEHLEPDRRNDEQIDAGDAIPAIACSTRTSRATFRPLSSGRPIFRRLIYARLLAQCVIYRPQRHRFFADFRAVATLGLSSSAPPLIGRCRPRNLVEVPAIARLWTAGVLARSSV